jgi:hypothetical protein
MILAIVSKERGSALHPFLEDVLDVCDSEVSPIYCNGLRNRRLALEVSILHVVVWHAKQPKVARTSVWRRKWVWNSFNDSLGKFLRDLVTFLAHRIVDAH